MSRDETTLLLLAAGAAALYYFATSGSANAAPAAGASAGGTGSPSPSPYAAPTPTSSPTPAGTGASSPTSSPTPSPTAAMRTDSGPQPLNVSAQGRAFIMGQEGLTLRAVGDAGGQEIGYGHVLAAGEAYPNGITPALAASLFATDLAHVEQAIQSLVTVPLTQGQFDALASLAYNIGTGAFQNSTLLADLNAGDYASAAAQFGVWDQSGGRVVAGLANRRALERAMFVAGSA